MKFNNDGDATFRVGRLIYNGYGVEKDIKIAEQCFLNAMKDASFNSNCNENYFEAKKLLKEIKKLK